MPACMTRVCYFAFGRWGMNKWVKVITGFLFRLVAEWKGQVSMSLEKRGLNENLKPRKMNLSTTEV